MRIRRHDRDASRSGIVSPAIAEPGGAVLIGDRADIDKLAAHAPGARWARLTAGDLERLPTRYGPIPDACRRISSS